MGGRGRGRWKKDGGRSYRGGRSRRVKQAEERNEEDRWRWKRRMMRRSSEAEE